MTTECYLKKRSGNTHCLRSGRSWVLDWLESLISPDVKRHNISVLGGKSSAWFVALALYNQLSTLYTDNTN